MQVDFTGPVIEWRGPAPFYFVVLPKAEADLITELASGIKYWGCVPVSATIGGHTFTTAMFPREGTYRLPVRAAVREAAGIRVGDRVQVTLALEFSAHIRVG